MVPHTRGQDGGPSVVRVRIAERARGPRTPRQQNFTEGTVTTTTQRDKGRDAVMILFGFMLGLLVYGLIVR